MTAPRLLALLGVVLIAPPALAASETATVVEILDGKELFIESRPAKVNERAKTPETVSTRNSRGQLRFQTGAVGRMSRFSQMRLGSRCFLLSTGEVLVSGPQSGCTQSSRMSVRGTNYVLSVADDGQAELSVLEGTVEVEPLRDGEPTGEQPTTVNAGESLKLTAEGVVLLLRRLSAGDYNAILGGPLFEGFTLPLPGLGALESYIRSSVPGVNIPWAPSVPSVPVPSVPSFGIPRFF
ncbi:MAG: iron dicitrate transport regulator FecR [Synechococcus sp.]|nr:iron dicitrate transport regulator FecR [Synechococcus sp.]